MKRVLAVCMLAALPALVQAQAAPPTPPTVAKKPHVVKGVVDRNDEYYWLRDDSRKNPELLAYLNAENSYADAALAPTKPLQAKLYEEFVRRLKQDDASVPVRERGYYYYTRYGRRDYSDCRSSKGS